MTRKNRSFVIFRVGYKWASRKRENERKTKMLIQAPTHYFLGEILLVWAGIKDSQEKRRREREE